MGKIRTNKTIEYFPPKKFKKKSGGFKKSKGMGGYILGQVAGQAADTAGDKIVEGVLKRKRKKKALEWSFDKIIVDSM